MTVAYKNSIGQLIKPGDRVVYIGWQHYRTEGVFLGLTPSGQVKIELQKTKTAYKKKYGKRIVSRHSSEPFKRKPYTYFIHKESKLLIDSEDYYRLPYEQRSQFSYDSEGRIDPSWEAIQVPDYYIGVMGLDRTFKIEN